MHYSLAPLALDSLTEAVSDRQHQARRGGFFRKVEKRGLLNESC